MVEVGEASTEQHVPVICSACTAGEHGECLDIAAGPELHTCECVEGSCRGEWQDLGMTEDRIVVDIDEVRRTAEAIEVLATIPTSEHHDTVERRTLDGWAIGQARPVFAPGPITLPEKLGGLPEDAPEQARYRLNRADRRRLAKRKR